MGNIILKYNASTAVLLILRAAIFSILVLAFAAPHKGLITKADVVTAAVSWNNFDIVSDIFKLVVGSFYWLVIVRLKQAAPLIGLVILKSSVASVTIELRVNNVSISLESPTYLSAWYCVHRKKAALVRWFFLC